MKLTRLRLAGFKSFVDPVELLIEPGLTGVVGPNGCGKSNLTEALRWVMGETSHKALRAGEMDDVIFSGSSGRPARNHAEVALIIDNTARLAPPPFANDMTLEVSRRIERSRGSAYRVNGREVRARDVQILFADASTGARSPSMVRQGQIGELIQARPEARRRILEEAAGIGGLHARRHEAEVRLKAAEHNLERLEDVLGQMRIQLDALGRQARQAIRYRALSADIRRFEQLSLHRAFGIASREAAEAQSAAAAQLALVGEATAAQSAAARDEGVAAHELPGLRDAAAAAGAALARLRQAGLDLDRDEREARGRLAEILKQLENIRADVARESALGVDATRTIAALDEEDAELAEEQGAQVELVDEARARRDEAAERLAEAEGHLAAATEARAERAARRNMLARGVEEARGRLERLGAEAARLAAERARIEAETGAAGDLEALGERHIEADDEVEAAEHAVGEAEHALADARAAEDAARRPLADAEAEARRLEAEVRALERALAAETVAGRRLIDALEVAPGYEAALGAALGEDLLAALAPVAAPHWTGAAVAGGDPALPTGAGRLADHVTAPPELARRLAQVGVVTRAEGPGLAASLASGQRLVSREGDLWRWDGFVVPAGAPSATARRLAERNRLAALQAALEEGRAAVEARRAALQRLGEAVRHAAERERLARESLKTARAASDAARRALAEAERRLAEVAGRRAALETAEERLAADRRQAETALESAQSALIAEPPFAEAEAEWQRASTAASAARAAAAEAQAAVAAVEREGEARLRRREAIARERASWRERAAGTGARLEALAERRFAAEEEAERLAALPDEIGDRRRRLAAETEAAAARARSTADAFAAAETGHREADRRLREAERAMAEAREGFARLEAQAAAAKARVAEAGERIIAQFERAPDPALVAEGLAAPADLDARLDAAKRDRERLGAVNLRADDELAALEASHATLTAERDELVEAIHRLRQGIASLNREGRERLAAAFARVDGYFRRLFGTLFGGGEAELQLVESDDPLEAGLEVIARPPGKKPQTLTLLSGGEQALTAMALIFAVFLTNPSPVCVLDEVDAPLDDANVERFCDLLDAMTRDTDTRFLVITHNPVTMARMDRLFGVTMAERGVSQLVSVDLEAAERMREAS